VRARELGIAIGRGNPGPENAITDVEGVTSATIRLEMLLNERLDPLFYAVIEATEEAIVNALLAAEAMSGRDGVTAHALGPELLLEAMGSRAGR
jgi:L-aminopeptidase/D-esterase-like protein